MYPVSESTLSTLSRDDPGDAADGLVADELVLLLECDRPLASSALHRLVDIDLVEIGRATVRRFERGGRRLQIGIPDARISSMHASLRREGCAFLLADEGSKNGLSVNGVRVDRHFLRDGDVIECGRTFFRFGVARRRPRDAALDLDAAALAPAPLGLATFHEPLAAQLRALVEVARTQLTVLILGASGTGKELIARAVHDLSRRQGAFVGVNCGALAENLVEAELFGARRGAFTGASADTPGLVRASDQGTLFLDEIGDLPARAQPALLRILQEREVLSVGATRPVGVDLRVVAATHRDLDLMAREESFRADLLARVRGFVVRMPTLAERLEDLGLLVAGLLQRHAGTPPTLSVEAMRALLRYGWPLNVRELEHALRGALALSPASIELGHLPASLRESADGTPASVRRRASLTPEQRQRREQLCALLTQHRGNISAVARELGKDRVQIRRWIRQLEISVAGLTAM
ncbi:MAG TPA: sigma 54-interacting transcriptional regulator [Polyangia bacterium]|nr:sigma 54-interacting transcriptional regulator [Polyangia bacterium]